MTLGTRATLRVRTSLVRLIRAADAHTLWAVNPPAGRRTRR
jgi:hypothetical protein